MAGFFKKILAFFGFSSDDEKPEVPETKEPEPEIPDPQRTRISTNAVFGLKDGFLVMIVDHQFTDIPSWIEWDEARDVVSIAHASGNLDEVAAMVKDEYVYAMEDHKKVLLVSNENEKKLVHFVPFIGRK